MTQNILYINTKPKSPIGDTLPISAQVGTKLICAFCGNPAESLHMCEKLAEHVRITHANDTVVEEVQSV